MKIKKKNLNLKIKWRLTNHKKDQLAMLLRQAWIVQRE
jgi:hypothetical protein